MVMVLHENGLRPLRFMTCTRRGRRDNNEDALAAVPELGLFVVADGMGGYEGGEVASQVTVDTVCSFFRRNAADGDATWPVGLDLAQNDPENQVSAALHLAHRQVCARREGQLQQMGATVAALLLEGDQAVVGHVGDSRVYRLRGGELARLTRDHSMVAEMQAAGMEPNSGALSNIITRALGTQSAEPELASFSAQAGDRYLLCTDGLVEKLEDATIGTLLAATPPGEACPALVQQAFAAGGHDNITAVVVELLA